MASPATLRYPLRDIKLLFVNDKERMCTYWLHPLINSGSAKLADMVRHFRPDCQIPNSPIYWQVYRRIKRLAALGYVEILSGKSGDYGEQPGIWCAPTGRYITLISRMQNSNRFLFSAKCREEMGTLKNEIGVTLAQLKLQRRKHCPYYLSARTRGLRIDAVFKLRSIKRHSHFKRRDLREVNKELKQELDYVQGNFEHYAADVQDLKCCLVHKESGAVKLIDYQTRFTDEDRKKGTIARFYRTWKKAEETYNTAILLTLTSYPPSEAPRHQHRESLWHVNRHFSVAWNAYLSLLQKRWKADRRDELLDAMRLKVRRSQLSRAERKEALAPLKGQNFRPKYLQVYEFQKNGMIHGHCVIFGRQWLDKFEQVKADWTRLGQGERCHIYAMHTEQVNEKTVWQWNNAKPGDARNRAPVDYLMKYLGKGVRLSMNHGMYWAINKRFFTNSQALVHDQDLPVEFEKLPAQYEFIGTKHADEIPVWLSMLDRANRKRKPSGAFDALGWGAGDPGGALA
jgi:hypothetical protein